ncbi:MAG: CBS domain-containing protein [bacterium]
MNTDNNLIKNYMKLLPAFVYENSTLFNVLETMKKLQVGFVSIIKEDFSIIGYIDKKKVREIIKNDFFNDVDLLKNTKIKDISTKFNFPIVLYPRMTIMDGYSTMKYIGVKCLPVVDLPWEKKIIGFLWLDDIIPVVEKNCVKIPA